jgi:S1-C subfamily serine protease
MKLFGRARSATLLVVVLQNAEAWTTRATYSGRQKQQREGTTSKGTIVQLMASRSPEEMTSDNRRRNLLVQSGLASIASTMGLNLEPANANLDPSETRRIEVFEKVAPSVVFIDTFTERRDVFTTNVLEVPLGTGSGFVWDDEGHIVT